MLDFTIRQILFFSSKELKEECNMDSENQDRSKLLIFVVGTSGSGKDSVMRETVTYLVENGVQAQILKRMITRTPDKFEESNFLSIDEFLQRKNEFALFSMIKFIII